MLADGSAGAGTATFNNQSGGFSNAGTIHATNNADLEISLNDASTYQLLESTAVLEADGGGSIELWNGQYVFHSGAVIAGTGVHVDTNATLQGASASSVLDVSGTLTQGDPAREDNSGGFAGPGTVKITSTGTLDIPESATLNPCSSTTKCEDAHVLNDGTVAWTGGSYSIASGGVLENARVLDAQAGNQSINGSGTLQNDASGKIVKSGGTNATTISVNIANAGTIDSTSDADLEFSLNDASTYQLLESTAVLEANSGGSIELWNGQYVFQSGAVISGTGVHVDTNAQLQGASASSVLDVTGTLTQGDPARGDNPGGFAGPGAVTITSTGRLDIPEGGTLNPCTSTTTCEDALVLNEGTVDWTGGSYSISSGGVLENANVLDAQAANQISGSGTLQNDSSGKIVKSGGSSATTISGNVSNAGTIEALHGGDLQLTGSDSEDATGVLTATGSGSALELSAGTQTYATGAQIEGTGVLLDGAQLTGATSTSTLSVAGKLTWSSGAPAGQGTVVIAKGATVDVTANVSMGFGGPAGHLDNDGKLDFQDAGSGFNLEAPSTIDNSGVMVIPDHWSAGSGGGCCAPGTITNESGGVIEKTGGTNLSTIQLNVTNEGEVLATGGAQLSLPDLTNFDTSTAALTGGEYDAQSSSVIYMPCGPGQESVTGDDATIVLGGGGDIYGCGSSDPLEASLSSIGSSGSLTLTGKDSFGPVAQAVSSAGKITVPAGATLTFGSSLTQTAGSTTVDGTLSASTVSLKGGLLTGDGTVGAPVTTHAGTLKPAAGHALAVTGSLTAGGGLVTVPAASTLSVGNGFSQSGGTTQVDGTFKVTPETITVSGGTFTGSSSVQASITASGGTVTPEAGKTLGFTGSLTAGGARVTVPGGATLSAGTGASQTAGTVQVDGTLATGSGQLAVSGGTLAGSGTVSGNVAVSGGTVTPGTPGSSPAPGVLSVNGGYTQQSTATFAELIAGAGAGSGYGQLAVSGTASIAGTLAVTTSSSYTPSPGQQYAVITGSSVSGTWGTFTGQFVNPGLGYRLEYDSADFSLLASQATDMATSITEKSSPAPDATVGNNVTYTVSATNNGPNAATGVQLADTLPSGVTFASATPSQGSCSKASSTVTCSLGTLASGSSATAAIVVKPQSAGTITDSATVSSDPLEYDPTDNSASLSTTVYDPTFTLSPTSGPPGTQVTVSGTGFAPGETATPTFTDASKTKTTYPGVTVGSGGGFATTVTIPSGAASGGGDVAVTGSKTGVAHLPAGGNGPDFTVVPPMISLSPTSGPDGTQVTVSGSGFVPGDTLTPAFTDSGGTKTTYPAVAASNSGGLSTTITIPASAAQGAGTVTVASGDSGTYSSPFTVTTPSADLSVHVDACDKNIACACQNPDECYTVTLTNNGPDSADSVKLTDDVPADTTFLSESQSSGPTFSCSTGANGGGTTETTTCTISTLASGASAEFDLTYQLQSCPSNGEVPDTATVTSTTSDPNTSNNTSTDFNSCTGSSGQRPHNSPGRQSPAATGQRRPLHPAAGPQARGFTSLVSDPAANQLLLFGGFNGSRDLSDTWTWTGKTWRHLSTTKHPRARSDEAIAYDPGTHQVVMFGGHDGGASLSDTWTWDGKTWKRRATKTHPSARAGASLAYDSATHQLILFGGYDGARPLADTWEWTGKTWRQQRPKTTPPGRYDYAVAYDPGSRQLIMFGGASATSHHQLADTWAWTGSNWKQLVLRLHPSGRAGARLVFDRASHALVLFGGGDQRAVLSDTWMFTGGRWKKLSHPVDVHFPPPLGWKWT